MVTGKFGQRGMGDVRHGGRIGSGLATVVVRADSEIPSLDDLEAGRMRILPPLEAPGGSASSHRPRRDRIS